MERVGGENGALGDRLVLRASDQQAKAPAVSDLDYRHSIEGGSERGSFKPQTKAGGIRILCAGGVVGLKQQNPLDTRIARELRTQPGMEIPRLPCMTCTAITEMLDGCYRAGRVIKDHSAKEPLLPAQHHAEPHRQHEGNHTLARMARFSVGERLGDRYRLLDFLGHGAYGEVWRALDEHRNLEVALKLLSQGSNWSEAVVLTALKNRYILEVHNADQFLDLRYLDTAIAAGSLDRTYPPPVEPRLAVSYMRQALRGLELCHARGLLHRDIKPANIFYDDNGDVRLGDFGIAVSVDANGEAAARGDPRYVSPESFTGSINKRADIYAAGVSLWELLTGRRAFPQVTNGALRAAIEAGDLPPLRDVAPHVSLALARIVRKAMSVDPADRFASAEEFDNALGALPPRQTQIFPLIPHAGHDRCWQTAGRRKLMVCVSGTSIDVRQLSSGRAVKEHCSAPPTARLESTLRSVFDALR